MELSLSLDAREVLFHLNYMGYHNISREQLKSFMIDLKKLIKYESQPQKSTTEINFQAGPHNINIQRLFENHTATSKLKQREKHSAEKATSSKAPDKTKDNKICKKNQEEKTTGNTEKVHKKCCKHHPNNKTKDAENHNKENIPKNDNISQPKEGGSSEKEPAKSKMWIRPKSAQSTRQVNHTKKRNDPVALYQEYQKDWERFRNNICESSRSELRWTIREKMLANH